MNITWLKNIGKILLNIGSIAAGFGPLASKVYPEAGNTIADVTDDLTKVSNVVQNIEAAAASLGDNSLSGVQKLQAAAPQVAQIVLQSELMVDSITGKPAEIADPAMFQKGCADLATAVVEILNSRKA